MRHFWQQTDSSVLATTCRDDSNIGPLLASILHNRPCKQQQQQHHMMHSQLSQEQLLPVLLDAEDREDATQVRCCQLQVLLCLRPSPEAAS